MSLAQEYGEMLPKTGIYYLPDFKVTGFLRMLEDRERRHMNAQEYYSIN
jgi:hypothetical protein